MNAETFCEHFATFADAPNGIAKLRELILQLGHTGRLTEHEPRVIGETSVLEILRKEHRIRWEAEQLEKLSVSAKVSKNSRWKEKYEAPEVPDTPRPQLPQSWEWLTIELVCPVFVDSPHRTPQYSANGEFPALRPRDVTGGVLDVDRSLLVDKDQYTQQSERRELTGGDVIYSRELSYGWAVVIPHGLKACLSQGMVSMRPHDRLNTEFFVSVLNGPIGRNQAHSVAVGAAHPHVNLKDIRQFLIPLPPFAEQRRIVEKVDQLLGLCDELAARQAAQREKRQRLVGATLDRLVSPQTSRHLACRGGSTASAPLDSNTTGANANEPPGQARWRVMQDDAHRLRKHFDQLFDTPTTIPQLRQTILQLAVQGQLVPQDPNDEPASALLSRVEAAQQVFATASKARQRTDLLPPTDDEQPFQSPDGWH